MEGEVLPAKTRSNLDSAEQTGKKDYYKENKSYIKYFDANNLYGQAMSYKLPYKGYHWLNEKQLSKIDLDFIINYPDGKKGYVLEVDLAYPQSLHDLHNAYPVAVEKVIVKNS